MTSSKYAGGYGNGISPRVKVATVVCTACKAARSYAAAGCPASASCAAPQKLTKSRDVGCQMFWMNSTSKAATTIAAHALPTNRYTPYGSGAAAVVPSPADAGGAFDCSIAVIAERLARQPL